MAERPLVAVLAAGRGTRFGGGKLEALCAGKPLGRCALDAVAADAKIKCEGGNACKGKSECHTATNACAGSRTPPFKPFKPLNPWPFPGWPP